MFAFPKRSEMQGLSWRRSQALRRFLAARIAEFPSDRWRHPIRACAAISPTEPESRAVLRPKTVAVERQNGDRRPVIVWLRVYAAEMARFIARFGSALHAAQPRDGGLSVPRILAADVERGIVLFESLPGTALTGSDLEQHAAAIGRDLCQLHAIQASNSRSPRWTTSRMPPPPPVPVGSPPEFAAGRPNLESLLSAADVAKPQFGMGTSLRQFLFHRAISHGSIRSAQSAPRTPISDFPAHLEEHACCSASPDRRDRRKLLGRIRRRVARSDRGRPFVFTLNSLCWQYPGLPLLPTR